MTRTVWARFQVPEDATGAQIEEALELVFRGASDSAFASDAPRRVVDAIRNVPPSGTTLRDLRLRAADAVHISYDYGRTVTHEEEWAESADLLVRDVHLDQCSHAGRATLAVRFEPGTAIVLSASAEGPGMQREGRRLDPLLSQSENLMRARMTAGERALHALPHASPVSGWYVIAEPGMVALARDILADGRSTRLVVIFEPGKSKASDVRREDANITGAQSR